MAAALVAVGGLSVYSGVAGAADKPTLSQVKQQVNRLTSQYDRVTEQLDQDAQQLSAARAKVSRVSKQVAQVQAGFGTVRTKVAQVAAATYEDSSMTSTAALLTSGDPQSVLSQASILLQLSGTRNKEMRLFLAEAKQITGLQQVLQRTEYATAALHAQLAAQKRSISKLLAARTATLAGLTGAQQAAVNAGSIGAGGTTTATYTGPTSTEAEKAVAFEYSALGTPYVYGGTGPSGPHGGYDCSGLAQAAWAAAGVSIGRDTYQQWATLPHIATSAIEPGDLLLYDGEGHVAMYVGQGYIIDAPSSGYTVEKIPMNSPWYAATFDGAVRP
jgi:cell wall-associated NlpC family hydrolase